MNCETYRAAIGALLAGSVDANERTTLVAHQQGCTDCRNLYETRSALRSALARTNADERLSPIAAALIETARRDAK
jgi:predicted anti-sigma-YlaC factor YlaD